MKVVVIGGGIIGISAAHYLNSSGHEVTVIDSSDLTDGCSFGNAGMVVPSHIVPLASPGMITRGLRWMLRSDSPFYIQPRLSKSLLQWGWQFYRHSTQQHVHRAAPALKNLSLFSKQLYRQLAAELPFNFGYAERGLLMLYQSAEAAHEEAATARFANSLGIEAHVLSADEVQRMEPAAGVQVYGGVYYPGDAHLVPHELMRQWIPYLSARGVVFLMKEEVQGFRTSSNRIQSVCTNNRVIEADEVVLAAGVWSVGLARRLGLHIPIQPGKGYSFFTNADALQVTIPSILLEARVAVTPMGQHVRFGGTLEITRASQRINMQRVHAIARAVSRYYRHANIHLPEPKAVWSGLRPCPPDGLPYIGRTHRFTNLIVATGHAMMGLSLGPATGKLVAELVDNQSLSVPLEAFSPDRF
jgi:D-amino-acid dehydrogenase